MLSLHMPRRSTDPRILFNFSDFWRWTRKTQTWSYIHSKRPPASFLKEFNLSPDEAKRVEAEMVRHKCDPATALQIEREPRKVDTFLEQMNRHTTLLFKKARGKTHDSLDSERQARRLPAADADSDSHKSVWALPGGLPSLGKRS